VNIQGATAGRPGIIRAKRQKTSRVGKSEMICNRGQPMMRDQLEKTLGYRIADRGRVIESKQPVGTLSGHRRESLVELLDPACLGSHEFDPQASRSPA
jgi:hypothetical protein